MTRTFSHSLRASAIGLLLLINCCELGMFLRLRQDVELYGAGFHLAPPSGYLSNGEFINALGAPCHLIRVTTDGCPFSRADATIYEGLAREAQQRGCTSSLVSPRVGQIKRVGRSHIELPLQFVNLEFGRSLIPFTVPQTILLDRNGQVIWEQEGSISKPSLSAAMHALLRIPVLGARSVTQ